MRFLRPAALALGLALGGCRGHDEPPEECDDLLDCVEIDLLEAMQRADEFKPGGVIIDAELSDETGHGPQYDVDIYVGGETREISIDAKTGMPKDGFDPDDQADGPTQAAAIESSTGMITMPIAVATAEATVDGDAVSAELDVEARVIQVVLFRDTERRVVVVDLDDGTAEVVEQGG